MPTPSPRHDQPPSVRRVLAGGAAAVVTLVTVAGGLGLGPGAAMASTTPRTPASPTAASTSGSGAESSTTPSAGHTGRDGSSSWLTIDPEPTPASGDDGPTTTPTRPDGGGSEATAPAIPASSGHGKRVVFDQSEQRVWLVDADGGLARTYLVSGSAHDNLQPGTYSVYSKSMDAVSFDGHETMRYMVRFTHGKHAPIGFHDIPRRPDGSLVQARDQLGTALSAGCIRQWEPDAKALWRFAPEGTKVVVVA